LNLFPFVRLPKVDQILHFSRDFFGIGEFGLDEGFWTVRLSTDSDRWLLHNTQLELQWKSVNEVSHKKYEPLHFYDDFLFENNYLKKKKIMHS
jgi:hypothetical protein